MIPRIFRTFVVRPGRAQASGFHAEHQQRRLVRARDATGPAPGELRVSGDREPGGGGAGGEHRVSAGSSIRTVAGGPGPAAGASCRPGHGFSVARIPLDGRRTLYSRYGDLFGGVFAGGLGGGRTVPASRRSSDVAPASRRPTSARIGPRRGRVLKGKRDSRVHIKRTGVRIGVVDLPAGFMAVFGGLRVSPGRRASSRAGHPLPCTGRCVVPGEPGGAGPGHRGERRGAGAVGRQHHP